MWSCGRKFEFLWLPVTLRHFIRLRWGFHCKYCFSMRKVPVPFWTLLFQIFRVVSKNRCHLRHHTFEKSQKYFYRSKNIKKIFLKLRCSDILLHLNTKRSYKRQGHATFEALCWLFCAMVESRNNGCVT